MSTAPPGWHRQPDGRDRYWDGQQWTEQFRDPSAAATEQIPLDQTRSMPAADGDSGAGQPGAYAGAPSSYAGADTSYGPPQQQPYGVPGGPPPAYGGQPPYGRPPQQGGNGWLKGCLIAIAIVTVIGVILAVLGAWFFGRVVDELPELIPTALPTEQPSEGPGEGPTGLPEILPTDLPTGLPTDLPTLPGQGESVETAIGQEFSFGGATIQSGWSVDDATLGIKTVTMQAVPTQSSSVPLLFTLSFVQGNAEVASTVCTVPLDTVGEAVDVACVPLTGEPNSADVVRVAGLGG